MDFLNAQISSFDYGLESSNKPPQIKEDHVKTKKTLKMSAAELLFFVRYLALIIGKETIDKILLKDDDHWEIYFLFQKILAYVTSPHTSTAYISQLDAFIPQFLYSYKNLYGNLKYKFHNLTHLTRVMRLNGPPVGFWSMRFEAYHRLLKMMSLTSSNKINIQKTITIRSQLLLAYLKTHKIVKYNEVDYENPESTNVKTCKMFFPDKESENILTVTMAKFNEIIYKNGLVLVLAMTPTGIIFGKIERVFIVQYNIFLLVKVFKNLGFDTDLFAYKVEQVTQLKLINVNELPEAHSCMLLQNISCNYITLLN